MGGEDTYPMADYRRWLGAAGYQNVEAFDTTVSLEHREIAFERAFEDVGNERGGTVRDCLGHRMERPFPISPERAEAGDRAGAGRNRVDPGDR